MFKILVFAMSLAAASPDAVIPMDRVFKAQQELREASSERIATALAEYDRLTAEAVAAFEANHPRLTHGTFPLCALADPRNGGWPTLFYGIGQISNEGIVLEDLVGRVQIFPRALVKPFRMLDDTPRTFENGRVGWGFARVKVGEENLLLTLDSNYENPRLVPSSEVSEERRPTEDEKICVVADAAGALHGCDVASVFPGRAIIVADKRVLPIDTTIFRPVTRHPPRPVWIQRDDLWHVVTTIGRVDDFEIYHDEFGVQLTNDYAVITHGSALIGRTFMLTNYGSPVRTARVKMVLSNGAIITSTDEVFTSDRFLPDENGQLAAALNRTQWHETVGHLLGWLPFNALKIPLRAHAFLQTRYFAYTARRDAPEVVPEGLVLGAPLGKFGDDKITVRPLLAGSPKLPLMKTANLLARKFGARTYIKPDESNARSFVSDVKGRRRAVFGETSSPRTLAHETTHARNMYARNYRGRILPRTNRFESSDGEGEQVGPQGYEVFFSADEAHARTVVIGLILRDLKTAEPKRDWDGLPGLIAEAREEISDTNTFLTLMRGEVARLRDAVHSDGGTRSVVQSPSRLFIRRPIPRRKVGDGRNRWAWMTVYRPMWKLSKSARFARAIESLDAMDQDNAIIERVLRWQEAQLAGLISRARDAGFDSDCVDSLTRVERELDRNAT